MAVVLPYDEVHVWRAALDMSATEIDRLRETLSPDERSRAARFRFPRDRRRFVAARGILRDILGRYVDLEPPRLRFCYGSSGKPILEAGCGTGDLRFNLSHSGELALFAVACRREVGVDLESTKPRLADSGIAERFFSPQESSLLRALPKSMQEEAFYNCWTRKEAYIKARGGGLGIRLDSFEVAFAPGEPAAIRRDEDDPDAASRWSLRTLVPSAGYTAAIVAEGKAWSLRYWCWQPAPSCSDCP